MGLLYDPSGGGVLMSKVPLYQNTELNGGSAFPAPLQRVCSDSQERHWQTEKYGFRHGPALWSYGEVLSYERGTPVLKHASARWLGIPRL